MRDGVIGGGKWGWTPAILAQTQTDLTNAIAVYTTYAQSTYSTGLGSVLSSTPANNKACQPFRSVNACARQMTLTVLDFSNMWQYFDVSKYPNGATVVNNREIYSDPQGTGTDSGNIVLPSPPPTQPISQITVWGWDRIDAVQVSYPSGGGPAGITTTRRMGDQGGGSSAPPHGGVFQVANNPVVTATGASGDIVNAMSFTFADGSSTGTLGGNYAGGDPFSWSFSNEILSSIHINGVSNFYGSADCVVFGFKFKASRAIGNSVWQMLYMTAPVLTGSLQRALSDAIKLGLASDGDSSARASYWNYLASRVK